VRTAQNELLDSSSQMTMSDLVLDHRPSRRCITYTVELEALTAVQETTVTDADVLEHLDLVKLNFLVKSM
jgi:hypothetical protein